MNSRKPTIKPEEDFDLLSAASKRRFHNMSNKFDCRAKNELYFIYIYLLCIHKESNFNRQKWEKI